jgi:cytochrome P450
MNTQVTEYELDFEEMELDPYPTYAEMRENAPVVFVPQMDLWMLTRWDDVETVAADKEHWISPRGLGRLDRTFGEPNILTSDGEVHDVLRGSIDPGLRPRAVNGYVEELVRPIAADLASGLRAADGAELVSEYLEPVSVLALGALAGLGDLDSATLMNWFQGLIIGSANSTNDPKMFEASDAVIREMEAYVDPILDKLEAEPDESLLSHMLFSGMPEGEVRKRSEIYPTYLIIVAGGMQEPAHGASSVLAGLLGQPAQLNQVVEDRSLIPRAIVEGLRWIAPIGQSVRSPLVDTEVGGVTIPKGAVVNAMIASANRDERRFERPDEFDINRSPNEHMAFGHGNHFCAGHFFARQVMRISMEELFDVFPEIGLDPDHEPIVRGWIFRAPRELRVQWVANN